MRNFTFILTMLTLFSCTSEQSLNSYEINIFHYHVGELDSIDFYKYKARIDIMDSAFVLLIKHPDSEVDADELTPYVFLLNNCESAPKYGHGFYCIKDTLTYQIDNKEEMIFKFNLLNAPADGWESVYFYPQIGEVVNFSWGWFTVSVTERIDDSRKNKLLSQLRKKLLEDTANFPGKHPQTLYNNR